MPVLRIEGGSGTRWFRVEDYVSCDMAYIKKMHGSCAYDFIQFQIGSYQGMEYEAIIKVKARWSDPTGVVISNRIRRSGQVQP